RGIRFVAASQQPSGLFARPADGATEMYRHGICTLLLAEAAGMTPADTAEELKGRTERAVRVILAAQRTTGADAGGWRYRARVEDEERPPFADLSVTA